MSAIERKKIELTSVPHSQGVKQKVGWVGRSVSWVSSNCSKLVSKVARCVPNVTLNQASLMLIAASYLGGACFALTHSYPYPYPNEYYDWAGGAAIALGSSFAISSVTAALQYLRGQTDDAAFWAIGATLVGVQGMLFGSAIIERNRQSAFKTWLKEFPKIAGECQPDGLTVTGPRINRLSCSLLEKSKGYIERKEVVNLPRSNAGSPGVHFPPNLSVVIKQVRDPELVEQMEVAAQICHKNGYHHLTVAKASYYQNHVVQSRLPISNHDTQLQITLYINHKELFTNAIKEFTGFLFQALLSDLISHGKVADVYDDHWPRFDNVAIYLDVQESGFTGKIALADLDTLSPKPTDCIRYGYCTPTSNHYPHLVEEVVRFFPYHMDEIIQEATKFYPPIANNRDHLKHISDQALQLYNKVHSGAGLL